MSAANPYQVLEIPVLSDVDSVKRAYRQLVLRSHPDKGYTSAVCERSFLEIQRAYESLIDPTRKSDIDRQLLAPHGACQGSVNLCEMGRTETGEAYTYPCRCGGSYELEENETTGPDEELVIPCTTCTLVLSVCLPVK